MAYTPIENGDTGLTARGIINGIGSGLDLHVGKSGSDVHNLGTISNQSASAVNITGGSLVGQYARFGTPTDNTTFEANGTLVSSGSATTWRDELGDVTKLKVQGSGIIDDAAESSVGLETACAYASDYLYTNIQMNHDKRLLSVVNPHIHFWQTTGSFPNLLVQYRWQRNGQPKVTSWTGLATSGSAFPYSSGTLNQIATFPSINPPTGANVSDVLQFRITRDKGNTSGSFVRDDNINATVYLTSFDVHFETDTLGSRTEYTK